MVCTLEIKMNDEIFKSNWSKDKAINHIRLKKFNKLISIAFFLIKNFYCLHSLQYSMKCNITYGSTKSSSDSHFQYSGWKICRINFSTRNCSIWFPLLSFTEEWDQFRVDNLRDFSTVKRKISNWIAINLCGVKGKGSSSKRELEMMQCEIGGFLGRLYEASLVSHKAHRIYREWEVDILKFISLSPGGELSLYRHRWSLQASIKLSLCIKFLSLTLALKNDQSHK